MGDEGSASLERIICHGNRPGLAALLSKDASSPRVGNWVICADGFKASVVAGSNMYCTPRPSSYPSSPGEVGDDYPGPYTEAEVGFPSERPEPWTAWATYAEDTEDPTGTVYAYVPVQMVRDLIALHGGEA